MTYGQRGCRAVTSGYESVGLELHDCGVSNHPRVQGSRSRGCVGGVLADSLGVS